MSSSCANWVHEEGRKHIDGDKVCWVGRLGCFDLSRNGLGQRVAAHHDPLQNQKRVALFWEALPWSVRAQGLRSRSACPQWQICNCFWLGCVQSECWPYLAHVSHMSATCDVNAGKSLNYAKNKTVAPHLFMGIKIACNRGAMLGPNLWFD